MLMCVCMCMSSCYEVSSWIAIPQVARILAISGTVEVKNMVSAFRDFLKTMDFDGLGL